MPSIAPAPTVSPPALRQLRRRAAREVGEACADAQSTEELIDGLRGPLGSALGVSGMIVGATDPATAVMSTATRVESLPNAMASPWIHNEASEHDVNKFVELHHTGSPPVTIHRATGGSPERSPRYRLNRRMGLGPELRVTFTADADCWGVASFMREASDPDFDDDAIAWLEGVRHDITSSVRRTVTTGAADASTTDLDDAPGVVTFTPDGNVVSMTPDARALLDDLWMCPVEGIDFTVPGEAYIVAALARAHGLGRAPSEAAMSRVRGRSGRWITVRGDCMFTTEGEPAGVALVIEPSRPADIMPVVLASFGLTLREREVLTEMTHGQTAGDIAAQLHISEYTVRDHIKSILAKTGTGSRGELLSRLFHHRA